MVDIPSPAVAVVGRHNSGKTTLVVKLIAELVSRGHDVGSVKHHHKSGFAFDVPGKDSYRQREAGASETVIACPGQIARVKTIEGESECAEIVRSMPGHDIVLVEGYRKSGLPTIEVMRAANDADANVAAAFVEGARSGVSLGADFTQLSRGNRAFKVDDDLVSKMPAASTIAIATDIPEAVEAAHVYGIPAFDLDAVSEIADFLEERFVRPRITLVIQAGGESRRMGQSKALVPFGGRPLICRMVERLAPVADELIITTNEGDRLAFLVDEYPEYNVRLTPDLHDYRGALPGLHTALKVASNPFVAIVACDMVCASPRLVIAEALTMVESGADVVVPVNKHGFEPFHALYRKEACLPHFDGLLESGERRAQALYDKVNVREFTQAEVFEAEPRGSCFVNANTPEELHALEAVLIGE